MERTLVLIKPDGVRRHLCGDIISRYEKKGLSIVAMEMMTATKEMGEAHYEEHKDKPFFGELVDFITSGSLLAFVLEGSNAVKAVRALNGATNPIEALPGTIRGDFGLLLNSNVVHASDSVEAGQREIGIWFPRL